MYLAINKITGEEIKDTVPKIADRLNVHYTTVYRSCSNGNLIEGVWDIYRIDSDAKPCFTKSLANEWEQTRKEIRELLKNRSDEAEPVKKKGRFRKPQEI